VVEELPWNNPEEAAASRKKMNLFFDYQAAMRRLGKKYDMIDVVDMADRWVTYMKAAANGGTS
jgi:hypothetical protein